MPEYQLRTPALTCLIVTIHDKPTGQEIISRASAPVVRWAHGKRLDTLVGWCERKWPGAVEMVGLDVGYERSGF